MWKKYFEPQILYLPVVCPNTEFGQTTGKYEEKERHVRKCMASGNQYVFHWLKRSQNKEFILEKNGIEKIAWD